MIVTILALSAGRGPYRSTIMATAVFLWPAPCRLTNDFPDADRDLRADAETAAAIGRVPRADGEMRPWRILFWWCPSRSFAGLRAGVAHLIAVFMATAYNFGAQTHSV